MRQSMGQEVRRGVTRLALRVSAQRFRSGEPVTFLQAGPLRMRCAIGRNGLTRKKLEGDGATPIGRFKILAWRIQPVWPRLPSPPGPRRFIRKDDGWCDDPRSGAYNSQIRSPSRASHEALWRDDGKYAVIGILDWNLRPKTARGGSAIFFHVCDDDFGPTAGCIAVRARDMRKLLPLLSPQAVIRVAGLTASRKSRSRP